ncbi:MAG: hypothetical protein K2G13_02615 [Muribaculaceae bacterium]|nr:hypothetical protein [Muribaculaceae bacterium]
MFVEFLSTELADRTVCVTSAIGRLSVSTDASAVKVTLSHEGNEFYSATLYAYDGAVTIDDLASVIELYFIRLDWHIHSIRFTVTAVDDTSVSSYMDVNCLYCAYDLPEEYDPSESFFTTLQVQRIPASAKLDIYGMVVKNNPVRYHISGFKSDGSLTVCEILSSAMNGFVTVDIPSIISTCKSDYSMERISAISVVYGSLTKYFFIYDTPNTLEFRFRNCFNCMETVFISGSSVMKTEVTRDTALCAGRSQQFNQLTTRTYEHNTAPLTRMEAAAMSQLIESHSAFVVIGGAEYPVVITDHTSEISNDDSTLNIMNFTWRFIGKRPDQALS